MLSDQIYHHGRMTFRDCIERLDSHRRQHIFDEHVCKPDELPSIEKCSLCVALEVAIKAMQEFDHHY